MLYMYIILLKASRADLRLALQMIVGKKLITIASRVSSSGGEASPPPKTPSFPPKNKERKKKRGKGERERKRSALCGKGSVYIFASHCK